MTRMRLSRSSDIEVDRTLESLSATLLILAASTQCSFISTACTYALSHSPLIRKNVHETSISIVYCHERNTTNTHPDPLGPMADSNLRCLRAQPDIVAITDVYLYYYDPDSETNLQLQPTPAAATQRGPRIG
jgi:hypothetical protein